jgi:hypothetical protein
VRAINPRAPADALHVDFAREAEDVARDAGRCSASS